MYPSRNGNNIDPIFYSSDQQHQQLLFPNDTSTSNPSSKQTNAPFTFSHLIFPSPLEDNNNINGIFHQSLAEAVIVDMEVPDYNKIATATATSNSRRKEMCMRKRFWNSKNNRDRHSKINTARGLRDRRMRLSLEVAKRFFGLQDMLGFDKASKTVEWLLNQAKREIKQLETDKNIRIHSASNSATNSECEEGVSVSGLDEVALAVAASNNSNCSSAGNNGGDPSSSIIRRRKKVSRKASLHNHINLARESRVKARERARERTKEKMRRRKLTCAAAAADADDDDESKQSQNVNPSLDVAELEPSSQARENLWTVLDEDDSLVPMTKWSPSMFFNSLQNFGLLHEQFAEFQSLGKQWGAYNNDI